ncbi:MAG: CpaD family pilus assembly protein [Beijerinckiaceae bacterium]|nr:CpaD family pilus assembly protein [Beijerinckiaceae bacterium]
MRADKTKAPSWMIVQGRAASGGAVGMLLLVSLMGCSSTDKMPTSSIPQDDYRVRHPILLSQDTVSIDLFPTASQNTIDRHTAKQIFTFAQDYRTFGHGPILVLVPTPGSAGIVPGIKAALAAAGVTAHVDVEPYPTANAALSSPVRMSFTGLKAKVGDQCGQWPRDLGSGTNVDEWNNTAYYNFGCATQSMIAAQTADPRDLAAPRGEDPTDTLTQSRAIEKVRVGSDPTTEWKTHNSNIGSVGGN